ncbi:MAG: NUDIX domain-containing protein, partial [Clostridia bacterium]|nr:NUDIX domain-containing protein [Clostridia bacterium]
MEYWDLYDENLRPLGRTHRRGEPMEPGTYHIGVDVWVINARGEILLTLRAPEKEDLPNEWENTCGSALAGETAVEAAMRELREETGILAGPDELQEFARRVKGDVHLFTYLLRRDVPLSS